VLIPKWLCEIHASISCRYFGITTLGTLSPVATHGYRIDNKGTLAWTDKAQHRFKERVREITSRNRGHNIQTQLHLQGGAGAVGVGQTAGEVVLLEAMEAATHAPPQPVVTGSRSQRGAPGDAQPQRLLADEPE
jgi:hypothetical protein